VVGLLQHSMSFINAAIAGSSIVLAVEHRWTLMVVHLPQLNNLYSWRCPKWQHPSLLPSSSHRRNLQRHQKSPSRYMQRPELTDQQRDIIARIDAEFVRRPKGIPGTTTRPKQSTGYGRSAGFGFIRKRRFPPAPSKMNSKWPQLWALLKELGATLNLPWDGVQVNVDCVCGPHRDRTNVGDSWLMSGGEYAGGELIVEEEVLDCKYAPLVFNGSELLHWNKPITSGHKWTLVFFSCLIPNHHAHLYPSGFKDTFPDYRDVRLPGVPDHEC
jgi:hypothetical protein